MAANILALEALAQQLPAKARLMGLDLGTKTIGLAVSDIERRIATPFETIRRLKFREDAARMISAADQ